MELTQNESLVLASHPRMEKEKLKEPRRNVVESPSALCLFVDGPLESAEGPKESAERRKRNPFEAKVSWANDPG